MNWRTVDMSRESRRDQFAYFQTLSNPYVGVTVQVDVTELAVWCRESGTSFFLAVQMWISRLTTTRWSRTVMSVVMFFLLTAILFLAD